MRLLPLRRTDSRPKTAGREEIQESDTPPERTTASTWKTEKKIRIRIGSLKPAIARPPRPSIGHDVPKRQNKNWFRRVFTKQPHHDPKDNHFATDRAAVADKRRTPTTCGNTSSDETLSHDSPNDESSQSDSMLGQKNFDATMSLLMSFSTDEAGYSSEETPTFSLLLNHTETQHNNPKENEQEIIFTPEEHFKQTGSYHESEDDKGETEFVPQFDRKEIISALFPKGYPSEKRKGRSPPISHVVSKDKMAALRQFLRQRKDAYGNVGTMVLKPPCDLASVESPICHPSTAGSSACSQTTPTKRSTIPRLAGDAYDDHELPEDDQDKVIIQVDSSSVIGMEITWDPTWELLNASDSPVSVSRSKLRSLQDVDQDADKTVRCLLGCFQEEESSAESIFPLDFPPLPALHQELEDISVFVLGFHFDPRRFPSDCEDELEIVFGEETKRNSLPEEEEESAYFEPTTIDDIQTLESSMLWSNGTGSWISSDKKMVASPPFHQLSVTYDRTLLFEDVSSSSHDDFSRVTNSSVVVQNLVGLCTGE
ncbi:hypothetical protein IV203_006277 [Nitzschia inconspicua]|uniref:Uncharacterized protein n=1 Tax=Nitzschia inconspicua TaxID=303405 RepID=A0A9K3KQD5_9STRA|nr:hypothetical protein IV203_006277 [Nitzschia inconspicua]